MMMSSDVLANFIQVKTNFTSVPTPRLPGHIYRNYFILAKTTLYDYSIYQAEIGMAPHIRQIHAGA